jgi:hypothetical protein
MQKDANFDLFPYRDVEIAKFIWDLNQKYNWLQTVVANWDQVKSEDGLTVTDILRDVSTLRQSWQSLHQVVLHNIKRKNWSGPHCQHKKPAKSRHSWVPPIRLVF